jgi:hypothetical protein
MHCVLIFESVHGKRDPCKQNSISLIPPRTEGPWIRNPSQYLHSKVQKKLQRENQTTNDTMLSGPGLNRNGHPQLFSLPLIRERANHADKRRQIMQTSGNDGGGVDRGRGWPEEEEEQAPPARAVASPRRAIARLHCWAPMLPLVLHC